MRCTVQDGLSQEEFEAYFVEDARNWLGIPDGFWYRRPHNNGV